MVRGPDSPRVRGPDGPRGPIVRGSEDYTVQHVICCITLTTTDHGASFEGHYQCVPLRRLKENN